MDAYIFRADMWCEDCIRALIFDQLGFQPDGSIAKSDLSTEDVLAELLRERLRDPNNEYTWDSDEFPKGPYADGGGEADTPQHCAGCDCFLENPLTKYGEEYVKEAVKEDPGKELVREWRDFYSYLFENGE